MVADTAPYYDWKFSREASLASGELKRVDVAPLTDPAVTLPTDGRSIWPVRPSHRLTLEFERDAHHSSSIQLFVVMEGAQWREVLPCPRGDVAAQAQINRDRARESSTDTAMRVRDLPPALRTELTDLLRDGRKVDAIILYAERTGTELAPSKAAIEALDADDPPP
jgi:hypothetical protein